jgi:hypothetical protein
MPLLDEIIALIITKLEAKKAKYSLAITKANIEIQDAAEAAATPLANPIGFQYYPEDDYYDYDEDDEEDD